MCPPVFVQGLGRRAEWWKLPEDWAAETPIFFRRTAFSQLKGCDKPNFVSSDQHRLSYRGSRKKVASTTRTTGRVSCTTAPFVCTGAPRGRVGRCGAVMQETLPVSRSVENEAAQRLATRLASDLQARLATRLASVDPKMGCPASARLASCRGQPRIRPRPAVKASLGSVPDASLVAEAAAEPGWPWTRVQLEGRWHTTGPTLS